MTAASWSPTNGAPAGQPAGALGQIFDLDVSLPGLTIAQNTFAGATIEETGEALGISPATVKREWATAKAWLHREVTRGS